MRVLRSVQLGKIQREENDRDNDRNATADDTSIRLAVSLEFLGLLLDLVLGAETQNDCDRTEDDANADQTNDTANHGSNSHATGLAHIGGGGVPSGDGGGLNGLGHVDDAVGGRKWNKKATTPV